MEKAGPYASVEFSTAETVTVKDEDGKYACFDIKKFDIVGARYDNVDINEEYNVITVEKNGLWYIHDSNDDTLCDIGFKSINVNAIKDDPDRLYYIVRLKNGNSTVINSEFKQVVEEYDKILSFRRYTLEDGDRSERVYALKCLNDNKIDYYDEKYKKIFEETVDD